MSLLRDHVTIIAEVGSNHDGDLDQACRMVDEFADLGADIIKFQSFQVDDLLAADDPNRPVLERLQMPREWYPVLHERCRAAGVTFLSTATSFRTLEWMEDIGVAGYKVASCNISHRPLLARLVELGRPLIVSTGLATLDEIVAVESFLHGAGLTDTVFLHCTSRYPCPPEEARLGNIPVLRERLASPVGFSDHTEGAWAAPAAVALGARVVEKHVSLDKSGIGLDHEVAVLPDTFGEMVCAVRSVEAGMGEDFSRDADAVRSMRRSLRAARDLPAGHVLTEDDVLVSRPEDGLLPEHMPEILGRRLVRPLARAEPLTREALADGDAGAAGDDDAERTDG